MKASKDIAKEYVSGKLSYSKYILMNSAKEPLLFEKYHCHLFQRRKSLLHTVSGTKMSRRRLKKGGGREYGLSPELRMPNERGWKGFWTRLEAFMAFCLDSATFDFVLEMLLDTLGSNFTYKFRIISVREFYQHLHGFSFPSLVLCAIIILSVLRSLFVAAYLIFFFVAFAFRPKPNSTCTNVERKKKQ